MDGIKISRPRNRKKKNFKTAKKKYLMTGGIKSPNDNNQVKVNLDSFLFTTNSGGNPKEMITRGYIQP